MAKKERVLTVSTVESVVGDAFSELTGLGEELREWHDNLPDGLKDHRSDIEEAADSLENLTEPTDAPDAVKELPVSYLPLAKRKASRSDRGGQATYELGVVVEVVEKWLEDNAEHEAKGDVESFRDEVQSVIDEADGVAYPGMYA